MRVAPTSEHAMGNSRSFSETVLKKLFALSRNGCAFPRCEGVLSKPEWSRVLAEICHVAGLNVDSARYDPTMTNAERNDYPNLTSCQSHLWGQARWWTDCVARPAPHGLGERLRGLAERGVGADSEDQSQSNCCR